MALKDDIDSSINSMEAATDSAFPNLPANRLKSSDIRGAFDSVYNEMRNINDMTMDALTTLNNTVDNKAPLSHTHAIAQITGLQSALDSKGTSNFNGAYSSLTGIPSTFTPSVHTHVINDITNATTVGKAVMGAVDAAAARTAIGAGTSSFSGSYTDLTNKPTIPAAATRSGLGFAAAATHINDAATNAPVDAATNAPTNSKTDYNVVTTLLGTLTDGLNQTNTAQNTIAGIVNANAVKQNAGFTILNTFAGRFNLSLDILENNGMMAA